MKSFKDFLKESDIGLVEPGLETSDDKEPYNQEVINNYAEDSMIQLPEKEKEELQEAKIAGETFVKGKGKCVVYDNGDIVYTLNGKPMSKEHLKDMSVDDYKERLTNRNGWKKVDEATEVDFEDLVEEMREKSQILKNEIDRIFNRIKYRFMVNVSYDKAEANKIEDELWKEFDKAEKIISKCWKRIG